MNMEDRLREAFEQEAELLHAPHGSPETAIRRGRRRRASNLIGGAALVLALVGGTAAGVQLLGNTDEPEEGNLASAVETDQTIDESISTDLQAAGVVDFDWERVTLPKPDDVRVWNIQVAAREDGFVAVGAGFREDGSAGPEQLMVWNSPNGNEWTLNMRPSPFDGSLDQMFVTEDGFVGFVRNFDGQTDQVELYTSPDGATWTAGRADLDDMSGNEHIWFAGAASGIGTTVVGGIIQTEPPTPPIILEEAGIILRENPYAGGFAISSLETGEAITTVPWEAVYGSEENLTVYGDDGAVILSIPWESFYASQAGGQLDGEVLTVEKEGVRLDLDNSNGTFVATDVTSGDILAVGDQDELYRPGRIQITHPDTGELLVDMGFEEFSRAEERSYRDDRGDFAPANRLLLLATTDGATWERIELGSEDAQEIGMNGVSFGPNGFVFSANRYGTSFGQDIWTSADGRTWDVVTVDEAEGSTRDGPLVTLGDTYFALDYSPRGRAGIASSSDGINWSNAYRADNRDVYYNSLTAGELGIIAIGQENETDYGPPLAISKEGRTMVLDFELGRVTVTEDSTGEVLTVIELDIYFEDPPPQFQINEETDDLTILDEDGTVLMFITQEEGEAAAIEQERDLDTYEGSIPTSKVAYSPDGIEWFTATTGGLDVAWPQGVAVGADAVVIVGTSIESVYSSIEYGSDRGEATAPLVGGSDFVEQTVGPADEFYEPETFIWVGRLR